MVFVGGVIISNWQKSAALSEWKGQTDAIIKRMDADGTVHGHYADERQDRQLSEHDERLKRAEQDTRHLEVLESEHRRLTRDVEELKAGRSPPRR